MDWTLKEVEDFCIHAHEGQKRDDGTKYSDHPIKVKKSLEEIGISDPEILAAALLHDVLEDTVILRGEIAQKFGNEVAEIVDQLTNKQKGSFGEKQESLLEHARKMGDKAKFVKLADRLDNLCSMDQAWEEWRMRRYARASINLLEALKPYPAGSDTLVAEINREIGQALYGDKTIPHQGYQEVDLTKVEEFCLQEAENYYKNLFERELGSKHSHEEAMKRGISYLQKKCLFLKDTLISLGIIDREIIAFAMLNEIATLNMGVYVPLIKEKFSDEILHMIDLNLSYKKNSENEHFLIRENDEYNENNRNLFCSQVKIIDRYYTLKNIGYKTGSPYQKEWEQEIYATFSIKILEDILKQNKISSQFQVMLNECLDLAKNILKSDNCFYQERATENFKDHVATITRYYNTQPEASADDCIEKLVWGKPDRNTYRIVYLIMGRVLFVCGDMYEASYLWGDKITFDWLSGLDVHYFHGKMRSIPRSGSDIQWSGKRARRTLIEHLIAECDNCYGHERKEFCKHLEDIDDEVWNATENRRDWECFLNDYTDNPLLEAWDTGLCSAGEYDSVNIECYYHWLGIKMAMEQLQKKEVTESRTIVEEVAS